MKVVVILDVTPVAGRRPTSDQVVEQVESLLEDNSQFWVPTATDEVECEIEVAGIGATVKDALESEAARRASKKALRTR